MTAQNGDRVLYERLETPRPTPKITLKRNWQSGSKSSSRSSPISPSIWKQRATWERKAEVQDDSKHIAEADQVPGNQEQRTSQISVDTGLSNQEVSTNALVKNEAVKKELTDTNTKALKESKWVQIKFCIRGDLVKEKMVFSQESSQAFFEMGNVELIDLTTSMTNAHYANTTFSKGQFFADAGKHIRPDLDMMRRNRAAFEVLTAPCFRMSAINAGRYKRGPNWK